MIKAVIVEKSLFENLFNKEKKVSAQPIKLKDGRYFLPYETFIIFAEDIETTEIIYIDISDIELDE